MLCLKEYGAPYTVTLVPKEIA